MYSAKANENSRSCSTWNTRAEALALAHQSQLAGGRPTYLVTKTYWPVCTLLAAALLLAVPMLVYGPMPSGHDAYEHVNFTRHFAQQFWGGELSPRWLLNMNHGLGSPTFFVYPPFSSYVYSLLQPAGRALHFSAFIAAAFVALFAAGVSAFLWIRTMASTAVSLTVAVLYMLMPYHLAGDFYRRTALPECWALVWMPLILYFATQIAEGKRTAVLALAVAYDLLVFSHPGVAVIFSPLLLLVVLTLAAPARRMRSALSVSGGMLLGVGLASFYFLPALYHSRYFPVSRLQLPLADNILPLGRSLFESALFTRVLAMTVDSMFAFIAIGGIAVFRSARPEQKKQIVLWLALCVAFVLLMSRLSAPFWTRLPWLLDLVQFPWRLNLVLCLAALPIAAIFLSQVSWPLGWLRAASTAVMLFLVGTWLFSYANVVRDYSDTTPFTHDPISEADGWFEAWKAPETDSMRALQASAEPRVRFVSGEGAARVLQWKPRLLELETSSDTGGSIMINQFYYPAWRAQLVGPASFLEVEPALPQGLLQVHVPPGEQKVRMEIPVGAAERWGRWLSGLSLLACVGLAWRA